MATHNIAVAQGDGIGPEIMREALKSLDAIAAVFGHVFNYKFADFGGIAIDNHGHPFPDSTKKIFDEAEVIMKGPIGGPKWDYLPREMKPEGGGLLPLREWLDTFANYRPVVMPNALKEASPLKEERLGLGVNILMIRELVGGIYFGRKAEYTEKLRDENGDWYALDECKYTEPQIRRIAKIGLEQARKRGSPLHNIHKANVLATSRFWNYLVHDVQKNEFPDVEVIDTLVDAAATYLSTNPSQFSVMLLENMMGDILTDQGGGILGSLGLMPSACVGPEKAYYEPSHGAANNPPNDISGKNIANPYSQIGSAAMMLEMSFGLKKESEVLWSSLLKVFGDGYRTQEIATKSTPLERIVSTSQFGDLVVENIMGMEN